MEMQFWVVSVKLAVLVFEWANCVGSKQLTSKHKAFFVKPEMKCYNEVLNGAAICLRHSMNIINL